MNILCSVQQRDDVISSLSNKSNENEFTSNSINAINEGKKVGVRGRRKGQAGTTKNFVA